MDFVNLKKNIEKIGKIFARQKISDKEVKPVETKSAEASSLDALASYSQAMISVKNDISSDDFERRLNDIKQKIKQNPDDYEWLEDSLEYIDKDNVFFVEQLFSELNDIEESNFAKIMIQGIVKYAIKAMSTDIEFVKKLWYSKDRNGKDLFPDKLEIARILGYTNSDNIEFAKDLCFGKDENDSDLFLDKNSISGILQYTKARNIEFARDLCFGKDKKGKDLFPNKYPIANILVYTKEENIQLAKELCFGKDENGNDLFSTKDEISMILHYTNAENIEFARELCFEKDENGNDLFPQKGIIKDILYHTNADNIELARELCFGKDENGNDLFPQKGIIKDILEYTNAKRLELSRIIRLHYKKNNTDSRHTIVENIELARELCFGKDKNGNDLFPEKDKIGKILNGTDAENIEFARELCYGKDENGNDLFPQKDIINKILFYTNSENIELARELCYGKDENGNDLFLEKDKIHDILRNTNAVNIELAKKLYFGKNENGYDLFYYKNRIVSILDHTNSGNIELAKELCFGKDENGKDLFTKIDFISDILAYTNAGNIELAKELCFSKDETCNDLFFKKDEPNIGDILLHTNAENIELAKELCFRKNENGKIFTDSVRKICNILEGTNAQNIELAKALCFGKDKNGNDLFPDKNEIANILYSAKEENVDLKIYLKMLKEGEITPNMLIAILDESRKVSLKDIKKLKSVFGFQAVSNLSVKDLNFAAKMIDLANKQDINEIDLAKKKSVIRNLVSLNTSLYSASDKLRQMFPLIPSNKEEYCSLLKNLSKAIGIETNELTSEQISKFNANIIGLASSIANLSDEEFNSLSFEQEYPKSEFIKNTFEIVKDLTPAERQKVYDYFGFELKHNDNGTQVDDKKRHSFSIIGYPVNLNNGKKLAKITDPNTKAVVEQLRPEVIKFSENNHVSCTNKEIEGFVNKILDLCPELRTEIGRKQAGFHEFDVFKHSLKVMQKIVQNSNFDSLDESDKKIMLMASMFHDITKAEAKPDSTHPNECSFDTFYITKKFNLTKEERNKLYELIKHHEWLGYTNRKDIKTEEERESRIKSVAYDLHYDNLFELSKIFTEADLKAVRSSNLLYNEVEDVFKTNSSRVAAYVNELKTNQPLLPVTKIPSSTRIKEAITVVNPDGSTNLKGIYQDKNGMVIIKFNEVENDTWEKIGFPKDSISSGIRATGYSRRYGQVSENTINTGNIKFFAHGLDFQEQMRNFDAFALPDSDALLSVSYMERPESKYKLFREQGLLLDVDTKYVHGGGETDAGSGCRKNLDLFKKDYAYSEGENYSDRVYIANLIKEALNLTDDEYIEFLKNNANKPITEIEPKEYQEPLVKAFATINSNERRGERSYNEMYITNPKPMGVYAYSTWGSIEDIMEFISERKDFLKEYALEKDMPFIVFGD